MEPATLPTPSGLPAWGSTYNPTQVATQQVADLAPLATSWHGALNGVAIQHQAPSVSSYPSNLSKFGSWIGSIASETGHIAVGAANWLKNNTISMVTGAPRLGAGFGHEILDNMQLDSISTQNQQISDRTNNAIQAYKSGRMTSDQYRLTMQSIANDSNNIVSQSNAVNNRISIDQMATTKAAWDTASALVTVLTAGFGGAATTDVTAGGLTASSAQSAGDWLASQAVKPFLSTTEDFMGKMVSQPDIFNALGKEAQVALQRSVAEVVSQNATMTASQIARASAANFALKYPLTYGFLEPSALQFYNQLDNKQYGQAVQTLAFNAALLLSGGAIGYALKFGGKALAGISERTFGQTSFWDELSKYYAGGQTSGFRDAVVKAVENLSPEEKAAYIRNLSAVEATNIQATGGDVVAAARRIATGLTANEGVSLSSVTHDEALKNMQTFAEAQRLADQTASDYGLGKVAVGRVDARALDTISAAITRGDVTGGSTVADRLTAWDKLKAQNPTQAWANNTNFDAQIKNMINSHEDASALDSAIKSIKAQFNVRKFPKDVAARIAKMGYIPIKPVVNEAPFTEGTGKLVSSFAQKGDLWTKSVQPLPILSSIGSLLIHAGLSPLNATQEVYQMYNDNLVKALSGSSLVRELKRVGETPEQTSDTLIKKLSNYAHAPTRGGVPIGGTHLRAPITDLRQLTNKDIMAALDISSSDAREVSNALMDSMIQVPLQIRGLGGKIEDLNYKFNPTAKAYARVQGAARFAWNPFFQAKLAYKTEALSQLEAGGKFPTIAGTNKLMSMIFPDQYNRLDEIRGALREAGILDQRASSFVISGEGVSDTTAQSANLTHKLLPSQERSIAGLIGTQADKVSMTPKDFIANFPNEVRDTVQMIAQYDRKNQFLNSPMARTLNLAFFPFRFEMKVATIMASSLAKTDAATQFAVIKGLYNGSNFLKSQQGQAWYAQNSDVIKLLTYFSPVTTLGYFANILGGKPDSVGSFGELGGLPLGWIPQLLDAEGLTHITQSAYLDPKTGAEIPDYVPATAKGSLLTAIQDLVGALYTYPGATAGLPSKTSIDRNLALGLTGGNKKTDLKQVLLPLSERQKQYQQALGAFSNVPQQNTPPLTPQSSESLNIPAQKSPLEMPLPKKTGTPRLKKSQFKPALLPGQSQLGQL